MTIYQSITQSILMGIESTSFIIVQVLLLYSRYFKTWRENLIDRSSKVLNPSFESLIEWHLLHIFGLDVRQPEQTALSVILVVISFFYIFLLAN